MRVDVSGSKESLPLEERIAMMEDLEAVRTLWAHYAFLADTENIGASIAALHTEDAVWTSRGAGNFGTYEGRSAIEGFFTALYSVSPFRHHNMTNVYIDLSDDRKTATGRWNLIDFCTMADGHTDAVLLIGRYECTFAKIESGWQVSGVSLDSQLFSNWDKGWVVQPDRGQSS
jgi:hypothetical protein